MDKYFKNVQLFNWDELDGETLILYVSEGEGIEVISGYDPVNGETYILNDRVVCC